MSQNTNHEMSLCVTSFQLICLELLHFTGTQLILTEMANSPLKNFLQHFIQQDFPSKVNKTNIYNSEYVTYMQIKFGFFVVKVVQSSLSFMVAATLNQ